MGTVLGSLPKRFQDKAKRALEDPGAIGQLLAGAQAKAEQEKKRFSSFWPDLKSLFKMLKSYWTGEYRDVPYKSLFSAVLALIYFVNPMDLIPDVLLFGLIDDALVLGYVLSSLKADIDTYQAWLKAQV
ncbi:MAG: YkvA family protein [bacterium]|nr:YkvA family protein [bacterium]